jgi:hypothetical protein
MFSDAAIELPYFCQQTAKGTAPASICLRIDSQK